jgi:hypothetical protein
MKTPVTTVGITGQDENRAHIGASQDMSTECQRASGSPLNAVNILSLRNSSRYLTLSTSNHERSELSSYPL